MDNRLCLLLVEDSESDAGLIVRLLEKDGYEVTAQRVDDPEAMRSALAGHEWDVIVADHQMTRFDAPEALVILRETGRDIPFLIVSGGIGEELAVSMMKSGAHDYINKNNLARLVPVVGREIREAHSRRSRREAEQSLRESEERMALAIQATQMGMFDFSPQTGVLIWSEQAKLHFGLPADAEVSYATFLEGLHPEDRERVDAEVQSVLRPGGDGAFAAEYRTIGIQDLAERWISSWGRVFYAAQGDLERQAVRFVGVTVDITERKRLEKQFRQAQKLESVGRLAGGVAHDFNNLLTVINGYSDLILEKLDRRDPLHPLAEEIRKAGDRASEMTRQLLAFSRQQVIDPKPMDLNQLIASSRKMLARVIGEDVILVTRLAPDLGAVLADAGQIHQVLMNLIVNARDAMPDGGQLTLSTANAVPGRDEACVAQRSGEYVLMMVSDTGIGMDEETRKRVFEPFFTTKKEGVGTGLGLATVYGIVKQCGGWIDLTTAPGEGATFSIALPRTFEKVVTESAAQSSAMHRGSETVLVVEDQDEVRRLAVMVLKNHGYAVLEARNGAEAFLVAEHHQGPIHLLLTDVVMPGSNGKELADHLRVRRPGLKVLFMSGYADNVIVNRPEPGDAGFLAKPFTPQALAGKVRATLGAVRRLGSHGVG